MYDAIIYKAIYGRTLTIKWPNAAIWPPVPHPWYSGYKKLPNKITSNFYTNHFNFFGLFTENA